MHCHGLANLRAFCTSILASGRIFRATEPYALLAWLVNKQTSARLCLQGFAAG